MVRLPILLEFTQFKRACVCYFAHVFVVEVLGSSGGWLLRLHDFFEIVRVWLRLLDFLAVPRTFINSVHLDRRMVGSFVHSSSLDHHVSPNGLKIVLVPILSQFFLGFVLLHLRELAIELDAFVHVVSHSEQAVAVTN